MNSRGVKLITRLRFIYGILTQPSSKDSDPNEANERPLRQNLLTHLGQSPVNYGHYDSDISEED